MALSLSLPPFTDPRAASRWDSERWRRAATETWRVAQRLRTALRGHHNKVFEVMKWRERAAAVRQDTSLSEAQRHAIDEQWDTLDSEARKFDQVRGADVAWATETLRLLSVHMLQQRRMEELLGLRKESEKTGSDTDD